MAGFKRGRTLICLDNPNWYSNTSDGFTINEAFIEDRKIVDYIMGKIYETELKYGEIIRVADVINIFIEVGKEYSFNIKSPSYLAYKLGWYASDIFNNQAIIFVRSLKGFFLIVEEPRALEP